MLISGKAQLLSAESNPYSIDGNEGVSNKARFNIEGEIYALKTDAETVKRLKPLVGETGQVEFDLQSRRERISVALISFDPE